MNNEYEKGWVYSSVIFFGTIIALSAFLNSNIEMSLKIAFIAALFIVRILKDDGLHRSTLHADVILAVNYVYFKHILNKINIRERNNNEENPVDVDAVMDSLTLKVRERISLLNNSHSASATTIEFIICIGISMAIVKYALPVFMN